MGPVAFLGGLHWQKAGLSTLGWSWEADDGCSINVICVLSVILFTKTNDKLDLSTFGLKKSFIFAFCSVGLGYEGTFSSTLACSTSVPKRASFG